MTRGRVVIVVAVVVALLGSGLGAWWLATDHYGEQVSGPYGSYPGTAGTGAELGRFTGPVGLLDGLAIVGAGNRVRSGSGTRTVANAIAAVDLHTGSLYWSYRRSGHGVAAHTVTRSGTYVLWKDGLLVRLDSRTAQPSWHRQLDPQRSPRLAQTATGMLLVESARALVAVSPSDGTVRWQVHPATGCVFATRWAAPTARIVAIGTGSDGPGHCHDQVAGYRLSSGRVAWRHDVDGLADWLLPVDDDTVVDLDAAVWAADSGRRLRTLRHWHDGSAGGGLLFASDRHGIYATDPRTDRRLWGRPVPAGEDVTGLPTYLDRDHVCVVLRSTTPAHGAARLRLSCYAPRNGEPAGGADVPVVAPAYLPAGDRATFRRSPTASITAASGGTIAVTETDAYLTGLGTAPPTVVLRQP
ncbi:PQQ-binding-like beta-propeller repeat protein [Actinocatenispora sera]|uniref:outer membrane protein assembly factor BamB family protein n=1 Tax=Actinocatenispora sera TaxID=390989 RepID=UPI0033C4AC93